MLYTILRLVLVLIQISQAYSANFNIAFSLLKYLRIYKFRGLLRFCLISYSSFPTVNVIRLQKQGKFFTLNHILCIYFIILRNILYEFYTISIQQLYFTICHLDTCETFVKQTIRVDSSKRATRQYTCSPLINMML